MNKKLQDSIRHAKEILNEIPDSFHGGLVHSKKVSEIAQEILKFDPDANKDVVITASWWHDTGRLYGNEGHEKRSAQLAYKDLLKRGVNEKFCRNVYLAIAHHRFDMKPTTLEGYILKDADKLSLLDPKRWQQAISDKEYHKFEHTIHILKTLDEEILALPISHKIYKILAKDFTEYIASIEDLDFEKKKEEITSLDLVKMS